MSNEEIKETFYEASKFSVDENKINKRLTVEDIFFDEFIRLCVRYTNVRWHISSN